MYAHNGDEVFHAWRIIKWQKAVMPQPAAANTQDGRPADTASDVLGDFAADLGRFLGGVQGKAASWLQQRKDIAEQLTQIRDTANQYLQQLSGGRRDNAFDAGQGGRQARQAAGKQERQEGGGSRVSRPRGRGARHRRKSAPCQPRPGRESPKLNASAGRRFAAAREKRTGNKGLEGSRHRTKLRPTMSESAAISPSKRSVVRVFQKWSGRSLARSSCRASALIGSGGWDGSALRD